MLNVHQQDTLNVSVVEYLVNDFMIYYIYVSYCHPILLWNFFSHLRWLHVQPVITDDNNFTQKYLQISCKQLN